MCGALKYALRQLFLVPTGDDPDEDEKPARGNERREEQPREARREAPSEGSPTETNEEPKAALQRLWFARLKKLGFEQITDDERHEMQTALFGQPSLSDLSAEECVPLLAKLRNTDDDRLRTRLSGFAIPF